MGSKTTHLCKRGLALLLAAALCISLLPGIAVTAEAATPSKTISASIKFYNHTGKRITELYFEDSNADDYGEEYLAVRKFRYWSNNRYIMVPLEFKKSAALDFFIRYSDGSGYEAKGLKLAKAKASGSVIDLTQPQVSLKVKNKEVASVQFVKREDTTPNVTEKIVTAPISFYNHTGKQIHELYFEASDADDYGEEYLAASGLTSWENKTTIQVPLTFSQEGSLDFYIRCSDGSEYEAKGLKLAKAQANGTRIVLTLSRATLSVNGSIKATAAFKTKGSARVASVKLNKTSLSLKTGSSAYLRATVSPSGADKKVTWTSSDPSVATVSSTGKVTGIKAGTATITAATVDGGYTAACQVTVTAKMISASINFYNHTGKQIDELYFEENGNSSWGEEYLETRNMRYWTSGKYIRVPLKFAQDASLDFYIRCSDGSAYEARGLSLAKAKASGSKIELTLSGVSLTVDGAAAATAAFVQKEAPTAADTALSNADWTALQNYYNALAKAYNEAASLYNSDQIKASKEIETVMKEAKDLIGQMGTIERGGLSTADGQKLGEAMKETAEALEKIVAAMEVIPAARTINVKFVNGTTVDLTNFSAKPQGGAGSNPTTLKAGFGETTLQFTVADNVSAFEITFVESANNQPYTMTVTFDSSVKDGDTLTVQFHVNEATQEIVYSQI